MSCHDLYGQLSLGVAITWIAYYTFAGAEEPARPSLEPELPVLSEDGALSQTSGNDVLIVSVPCQVHWQISVWSHILENKVTVNQQASLP